MAPCSGCFRASSVSFLGDDLMRWALKMKLARALQARAGVDGRLFSDSVPRLIHTRGLWKPGQLMPFFLHGPQLGWTESQRTRRFLQDKHWAPSMVSARPCRRD